MKYEDYKHLAKFLPKNYIEQETLAKKFVEENYSEIVEDLHFYEATKKINHKLNEAIRLVQEIEPVYALAEVHAIIADIKLEKAFEENKS